MSLTKATYSMIKGAPVNVLDFGAVGDGVTDDTAAIQAAIAYAFTLIGTPRFTTRTIYFPSGEYLVTQNNWLGAAMPTLGLSSLIGYTMLGDGRKNTLIRFKPSVSGAYIYDQTVAGVPALLGFETNGIGFVFDQSSNGGGEIHGFRVQGVSGQASQLIKFVRGINYVPNTTRWLDYVGNANEDNTIIEDFHFPNGLQTLIRSTDSESLGHYVRNVYVGSLSGHLFEMTRGGNLIYDGGNVTTNSSYVGEVSILKTGYGTLTPGETQQDFAIKNVRVELRSATSRALYVDRQAYAQIIFDKCNFAGGSYQNQALAIIPVQSQAKIVFRSCIWPQQSAISATAGKVQMVDGRLQTDYSSNNAAISEVIFENINFSSTRTPAYTSYSLVDWTALTVAGIYRTVSVVYRSCDTIPDSVEYGYERKTGRTFRYGFIANIPFRGETFPIGDGTSAPVNTSSDFNIVVPLNNFVAGVEINRRAIGGWGGVLNYAIRVVDKTEYDAPGTGTVYGSTTAQGGGLAINQTIYINKTFTGSLDSRTLYLQIASGYGVSGAGGAGTVVDGGALLRLS